MAKSKVIFKENRTTDTIENCFPDKEENQLATYDVAKLKNAKGEKENFIPKTPRHKSRKTGHKAPHINMQGTETVPVLISLKLVVLKSLRKLSFYIQILSMFNIVK